MRVDFRALEYWAEGRFHRATYAFEGAVDDGWVVTRNGQAHLTLGSGYRLFRTLACGICATDLARHHLPFPLPQITGHEVLAEGDDGRPYALEINASHRALGSTSPCAFCTCGLDTHCPERLTLGIHALPGGFGPWVLAPRHAAVAVPDDIPPASAVLIEPLAAALHAVHSVDLRPGDEVAVLGPRRLGLLVIAALAASRRTRRTNLTILALSRHDHLLELARNFQADRTYKVEGDGKALPSNIADIVIDTTGTPEGLELAFRLARREVHLKSTHGRPAVGLEHLTELVVDELSLGRFPHTPTAPPVEDLPLQPALGSDRPVVAWLAEGDPTGWLRSRATVLRGRSAESMLGELEANRGDGLGRADAAVVSRLEQIDEVIRPSREHHVGLVRPRGSILLHSAPRLDGSSLLASVLTDQGLRLTSSRCGDFEATLRLFANDPTLQRVGADLVTHVFDPSRLDEAFAVARSPACIKAIVTHGRSHDDI